MASIRARLTLAYAATFVGALVLFSISLLVARREFLLQDMERRVQAESEQVVRAVNLALSTGTEPLLAQNDPLAGPGVSARMSAFLRLLDGYVLVQDSTLYDIYVSPMVERLSVSDRTDF